MADLRGGRVIQGGSTITQQYVKNVYTGNERTLTRKVKEAILANRVDRKLSKDEILFRYLNTIYLGRGRLRRRRRVRDVLPQGRQRPHACPRRRCWPASSRRRASTSRAATPTAPTPVGVSVLQTDAASRATSPSSNTTRPPRRAVWPVGAGQAAGARHADPAAGQGVPQVPVLRRLRREVPARARLRPRPRRPEDPDQPRSRRAGRTAEKAVPRRAQRHRAAARDGAGVGGAADRLRQGDGRWPRLLQRTLGQREPRARRVSDQARRPTCRSKCAATCWNDATAEIRGGGPGRQTGSSFKPFTLAAALEKGISPNKVYPAPGVYKIPGLHAEAGRLRARSVTTRATAADRRRSARPPRSRPTPCTRRSRATSASTTSSTMAKKLGVGGAWYSPDRHGLVLHARRARHRAARHGGGVLACSPTRPAQPDDADRQGAPTAPARC